MPWTDQVGELLQQFAGGAQGGDPHAAFDEVARHAPQGDLAGAIAGAFQSNQTPPIGRIVSQVFGSAGGAQKAGILNTLIAAIGPGVLQQVLQRFNLGDFAGAVGGGRVSEAEASQVPPEAAGAIAEHAQQANPNIVNELGGLLAGNPDLLKSLGGGALSAVMSRLG
jgi:hypothetical protein